MKTLTRLIVLAGLPALVLLSGCRERGAVDPSRPVNEQKPETSTPPSMTLTAEAVGVADIQTEPAVIRVLARRISAAGELELNARRIVHLTARTPGRLERVLVVRGDRVREGQLLAEIYSPDYLTLQAEYIQAAARARRMAGDMAEEATARSFLTGARERLRLLGESPSEIENLDTSPVPRPLLAVRAPIAGTVFESAVLTGDRVDLGTSLFRLADLSTLWARLHIQEKDLSAVKAGADVVLGTQAYPGEDFRGRLVLVGDVVDSGTRTIEGRVEVPNIGGRLRPGMFIEASAAAAGERRVLVVPDASVQDDDGKPIVFVKTGERTFERREVQVGERLDGHVEVLQGLSEGDIVVTSGSFLLKSEMRNKGMEDENGND